MKRFIRPLTAVLLVIVILFSSMIIVAAEVTEANGEVGTVSVEENGVKAYELVWKFKIQDDHLWKRRWNMTLGCWYDPEWILVY